MFQVMRWEGPVYTARLDPVKAIQVPELLAQLCHEGAAVCVICSRSARRSWHACCLSEGWRVPMLRSLLAPFPLALLLVGCSSGTTSSTVGGPDKPDPEPPGNQTLAIQLARVSSCEQLQQHLRERTRAWMNGRIDDLKKKLSENPGQDCLELDASPSAAVPGASNGAPTSVSQTNNQVADVDEADLVKTDGQFLYLAQGNELRIVGAWPAADAALASRLTLPGQAKKLFIEGDRALVYVSVPRAGNAPDSFYGAQRDCTYGYDCDFSGDGSATQLAIFDISDRSSPQLLRTLRFPGSLIAARRIGTTVHTVVSIADAGVAGLNIPSDYCGGTDAADIAAERAALEQARVQNEALINAATFDLDALAFDGERSLGAADCSDFYRESAGDGQGITSLVSLDLAGDADPALTHIMSRGGAVYASSDSLYMAVSHQRAGFGWYDSIGVDEASTVHQFRIGDAPERSGYLASGAVPGRVLNQFSMDQYQGVLRIATTKGHVPSPGVESTVSVLSRQGNVLELVGQVDHIAPEEDIRSVRFDGPRGYLVTFKKTDPLFVLDLAKAAAPAVVGELKIPGFSTYMHQLDDTHLLALGYEADDMGSFAYFNGVQLQIFDVTDPTKPALLHKKVYGTRGSSSSALTDHLGFTYLADRGLLTLPLSICEGGGNGMYGSLAFSGVVALDVNMSKGFNELGRLEEPYPASASTQGFEYGGACQDWWTSSNSVVERTVVMDDFVYAVSKSRVRVQALSALGTDVAVIDF